MDLIVVTLGLIATYCFGMWLYQAGFAFIYRGQLSAEDLDKIAIFTFRLGLCGTISLGFLGLLLKG